jgi:hypothetical protein
MRQKMLMAAAVALLAGSAMAGTVRVHYTPFQTGTGGEFRMARVTGNAGVVNMMSDVTGTVTADNVASSGKVLANSGGQFYNAFSKGVTVAQRNASTNNRGVLDFQTFCIERNEHVNDNTVYAFSIDAGAIRGGLGGGNPDVVGHQTAWLYTNFRNGTLGGYNLWGTNITEAQRESSAKALQHVIWYFENELGGSNQNQTVFSIPNLSNLFVSNPNGLNAGEQTQAATWATAAINAVTAGFVNSNVRALNLWVDANGNGRLDQGETLAQSQLTIIPLPTGVAMALAGMGLVAGVRRRRSV